MNCIIQFVILLVFATGLLVRTSARARSKLHPAERFEFCVAQNLSGLSMFNEEDKEQMEKIVLETSLRMREMRADPDNASNARTMLRLFAAALACVVAECDSSVRSQREKACITALEACAESLKEPAGAEVVKEMKKIFAAMNRELSILGEIVDNSAPVSTKKKERFEKEEMQEEKGRLAKAMVELKKEHLGKESEVKGRSKRAYIDTFRYQGSRMPPQSNPTLESIIADKLLKSTTFNNFFSFGISQEDAIFFSRSMVASGLRDYRYDIIEEAKNAVAVALSRLGSYVGPNDYAYAIGRAIASVLSAHDLAYYASGLSIGSSLIQELDGMLGTNPSSTFESPPSFGSFASASAASSGWGSSSAVASSISSRVTSLQVNPSYIESSFDIPPNSQSDKNQFQNRLSYFLSQSRNISRKICNGPFPDIYEIMNSAFSDYGNSIASTIATVVSNSLSMLPTEAACTQYSEVISEIVADTLNNNGYIPIADPQAITNKISDLISRDIQSTPPQNPSSIDQQTFSGNGYQLNPSFSDVSYSAPDIPASPKEPTPDSDISSIVPNTSFQQQNPTVSNSSEFPFDASSLAIQPPSKQDLPKELSSDGINFTGGTPRFSNGTTAENNNSSSNANYPSDVLPALEKTDRTSLIDISPPVILGPGPVIPVNLSSDTKNAPESKVAFTNETTTAPNVEETTKAIEITTPVPVSTNFQFSTAAAMSSTPAPEIALRDAFENPSKLSEFLMKKIDSPLRALNVTSEDEIKQPNLPITSESSTGVMALTATDKTDDIKPTEKSPASQVKTNTEAQPSLESPQQQNLPPSEVPLIAPKPITDELSALVFADKVSSIVSSSINLIRSQNFQFDELCRRLNQLAPLVDLPPLDVCSEIPLIDYLLHILNAVTYSLGGEK